MACCRHGEGLSSSRLSLLHRSSVASCDVSTPPPSPRISDLFGRLRPSPASSPQTTPTLSRLGRHLSEPCTPSPTPSLIADPPSGHASAGTPRRCSAPEGLRGGAGIPQVVVYPPEEEEEVFRAEDKEDFLSHQDPSCDSGKYLPAQHGTARHGTARLGSARLGSARHSTAQRQLTC
ncbi:uncharacterized protein LOC143324284 [Chaetodon auriga]|uniref:uncharacterized protein LOC143324284 n=1 Tax=Chaetodon auriga TaxID=39042 RepID=UPI004032CC6B